MKPNDYDELDRRFSNHPVGEDQIEIMQGIRDLGRALAQEIGRYVPEGREQSTALTKVEEAVFWAVAGVARPEETT